MTVDDIDLRILTELVRDSRQPVAQLAERANVSRAHAYTRLSRLVDGGVVEGFTTRVDPVAVGLPVSAVVLLSGGQSVAEELRPRLEQIPEIEYAAYLAGRPDILLIVRVDSIESLKVMLLKKLRSLPGIRSTETLLVIDEVIRRQVLPAPR